MFDSGLDLSDVLKRLRRADDSLTEFVAPLWPGVQCAAVWIEGRPQLFRLAAPPAEEGYYLLGSEEQPATIVRPASDDEAHRYRSFLAAANVILLEEALAYPVSYAERLQGIIGPRPIHFAAGQPLRKVQARFDGLNLLYDRGAAAEDASPLARLLAESTIFTPGELLGIPGQESAGDDAERALTALRADRNLATEYRLKAVLEPAGAVLEAWERESDGIRVQWRFQDEEQRVLLASANSPITSGICLPGARAFDPAALTRLLLDHALDGWRTPTA